ncbi:MAG: anion permease [Thermoplasmata archaeon]
MSLSISATVTGSAPNAVTSALIAQQTTWSFVDWMKIGLPTIMMLLVLSWYVLQRVFPVKTRKLDTEPIRRELSDMGEPHREREIDHGEPGLRLRIYP